MQPVQYRSLDDIARTLRDTPFPRQITIEICAHCNLACTMCPHPHMQRDRGYMSDAIYALCIDEIASVNRDTEVWLADHGESLLAGTALIDKIEYAKSRGLRNVFLNTNGTLLTSELARGLIDSGLDLIVFGIDACDDATYSRIRVGGNLSAVIRNVEELLALKKARKQQKPEIWVQLIEMEENEGQTERFRDFWHQRGAGVKIRRKLSWGSHIESRAVREIQADRIPCPWIMNLMHILWDGRVCRCSGDHECLHTMGTIPPMSIQEIWQGTLKQERDLQLGRRFEMLIPQCQSCLDWKVSAAEKFAAPVSNALKDA